MAGAQRQVETFSKPFIGFNSEAVALTAEPMSDIFPNQAYPLVTATKFAYQVTDRTKEYWCIDSLLTFKDGATTILASNVKSYDRLGGTVFFVAALTTGTAVTVTSAAPVGAGGSYKHGYVPMYFCSGGRAFSNTDQSSEIDTTATGDSFMSGAPNRRKVAGAFSFIPGTSVVNQAGVTTTIEEMLLNEKAVNLGMVIVVINDITNPNNPRDAAYGYIGNADKTRAMGAVIDRAITWYLMVCPDSPSYRLITQYP